MSVIESYVKTRQLVEERVARRKAEFTALGLLCEESLHLLWVHLDLYLRRNLPRLGHPLNGIQFSLLLWAIFNREPVCRVSS